MPFGAIFGALLSPNISRNIGFRKYSMITNIIGIVGSIACVMPNTWLFFSGRVLGGYTTGAFSAIASPFIRDISPAEIAGKTGILVKFSFLIGLTISFAGGLVLPTEDYENDPMTYWYIAMFLFLGVVNAT